MTGFFPHGPVGVALLVLTILLAVILIALLVACGLLFKHGYFTNPFTSAPYHVVDKEEYLVVDTVKKRIQPNKDDPVDMRVYPARWDELVKPSNNSGDLQMLPMEEDRLSLTSSSSSLIKQIQQRHPRPDSGVPYTGLGRLTFALRYSAPNETLSVHLLHGRYISQRTGELALWHVIRICLKESREDEQQSMPEESPIPDYDQEFNFHVAESEVGQSALLMTVWDTDIREQKTLIGYVRVALANFGDILDGPEGTGPLVREITEDAYEQGDKFFGGQIMLSLKYSPTLDRMIVSVLRAVNIHTAENVTVLYAKVFLTLSDTNVYSKKTATVKNSSSPVFNSNVLLDQLTDNGDTEIDNLGLIISLRAKTTDRKKFVLGQVALGNFKHSKEDGTLHWKEAIDSPNVSVAQWHKLVVRQ